ncbi:MAG: ABC transporter permease [Cyclobacteriaceae bacterium]|nr:ABC transporter permease [Cyclobacteriaceae bacterium]
MFTNYLKLIIRNLKRRGLFTFINVTGLAIGLASVLVIISFVKDELSYDQFHSKHDQIYRITLDWLDDGKRTHMAAAEAPLAEALEGKLTGVQGLVRVYPLPALVSVDRQSKNRETKFCFADSIFFSVFDFQFIHGNPQSALENPMSVVLTESKAIEYFGKNDAVGKDIYYETDQDAFVFHVTGVIKDFPQQSHFKADFLASFQSMEQIMPWYNSWYYPQMHTYLLANPGIKEDDLERQINVEARKSHPVRVKEGERTYHLQKLTDIHLYSNLVQEWEANSNISFVYLFSTIAIFILIIASINFMNLSTAQAATRAKEVGLRKVMGASRKQLVLQFLGETLLITFAAFVVGFALAEWLLIAGMNKIIGGQLSLDFLFSGYWIIAVMGSVALIGILSGIYPSFFLSRYKPVKILKGLIEQPGKELTLRKGMVVFQFVISGVLIIFTWIVLNQNDFMLNKDLGFDKDHVVAIKLNDNEAKLKYPVLKNSLLESSEVSAAALSSALPGNDEFYGFSIKPEEQENEVAISTLGVDEDFLKTYGLELLGGRDFSAANKADENGAYIINEAAAKSLGWNDPVGKSITFIRYTDKREEKKGNVIGVVRDFNFKSLHHKVEPLLIYINRHEYYADYLSVRFSNISPRASVELLQDKWSGFIAEKPLEFVFMDEQLNQHYNNEVKRAKVFSSFAALSIFISCLGLFGLATFSMQQKRREIGIRKVLGASVVTLLKRFSTQFLKLVLIANMIAWPVAWYASEMWLQNFAYAISPGLKMFVLSTLAMCLIAMATIGLQTLNASMTNPVDALKEE